MKLPCCLSIVRNSVAFSHVMMFHFKLLPIGIFSGLESKVIKYENVALGSHVKSFVYGFWDLGLILLLFQCLFDRVHKWETFGSKYFKMWLKTYSLKTTKVFCIFIIQEVYYRKQFWVIIKKNVKSCMCLPESQNTIWSTPTLLWVPDFFWPSTDRHSLVVSFLPDYTQQEWYTERLGLWYS